MAELVVELKHVNIYQQQAIVLKDVSVTIEQSEFVYLIGKTGTGKSSLLRVLYCDLPLTEGEGRVCGYDLKKMSWKETPYLRRKLGIVFQDFQLLTDRSVEDNLRFVLKATGWKEEAKMQARIEEVLDLVRLRTKGFKMPHELSGGEQQRIVIARALLNHPDLILADEPTGNLDPEASEEIIRLLKEISQSSHTAVLLASHDYMTLQKFPSRTLKCENGAVVETSVMEPA
ncbi:MAG: ATP-binding cassette domain-containing protein [Chitinophagales bacterium]|nr:ATP-binding cassette domain-containing protein [Chitinophagales bacterium]